MSNDTLLTMIMVVSIIISLGTGKQTVEVSRGVHVRYSKGHALVITLAALATPPLWVVFALRMGYWQIIVMMTVSMLSTLTFTIMGAFKARKEGAVANE